MPRPTWEYLSSKFGQPDPDAAPPLSTQWEQDRLRSAAAGLLAGEQNEDPSLEMSLAKLRYQPPPEEPGLAEQMGRGFHESFVGRVGRAVNLPEAATWAKRQFDPDARPMMDYYAQMPEPTGFAGKVALGAGKLAGDLPLYHAGGRLAAPVTGRLTSKAAQRLVGGGIMFSTADAVNETLRQAQDEERMSFGHVAAEAARGFVTGMALGSVGGIKRELAKFPAEVGALTVAGAAVEGRLPGAEDLALNTILLGMLKGGGIVERGAPTRLREMRSLYDSVKFGWQSKRDIRNVIKNTDPQMARILGSYIAGFGPEAHTRTRSRLATAKQQLADAYEARDIELLDRAMEAVKQAEAELMQVPERVRLLTDVVDPELQSALRANRDAQEVMRKEGRDSEVEKLKAEEERILHQIAGEVQEFLTSYERALQDAGIRRELPGPEEPFRGEVRGRAIGQEEPEIRELLEEADTLERQAADPLSTPQQTNYADKRLAEIRTQLRESGLDENRLRSVRARPGPEEIAAAREQQAGEVADAAELLLFPQMFRGGEPGIVYSPKGMPADRPRLPMGAIEEGQRRARYGGEGLDVVVRGAPESAGMPIDPRSAAVRRLLGLRELPPAGMEESFRGLTPEQAEQMTELYWQQGPEAAPEPPKRPKPPKQLPEHKDQREAKKWADEGRPVAYRAAARRYAAQRLGWAPAKAVRRLRSEDLARIVREDLRPEDLPDLAKKIGTRKPPPPPEPTGVPVKPGGPKGPPPAAPGAVGVERRAPERFEPGVMVGIKDPRLRRTFGLPDEEGAYIVREYITTPDNKRVVRVESSEGNEYMLPADQVVRRFERITKAAPTPEEQYQPGEKIPGKVRMHTYVKLVNPKELARLGLKPDKEYLVTKLYQGTVEIKSAGGRRYTTDVGSVARIMPRREVYQTYYEKEERAYAHERIYEAGLRKPPPKVPKGPPKPAPPSPKPPPAEEAAERPKAEAAPKEQFLAIPEPATPAYNAKPETVRKAFTRMADLLERATEETKLSEKQKTSMIKTIGELRTQLNRGVNDTELFQRARQQLKTAKEMFVYAPMRQAVWKSIPPKPTKGWAHQVLEAMRRGEDVPQEVVAKVAEMRGAEPVKPIKEKVVGEKKGGEPKLPENVEDRDLLARYMRANGGIAMSDKDVSATDIRENFGKVPMLLRKEGGRSLDDWAGELIQYEPYKSRFHTRKKLHEWLRDEWQSGERGEKVARRGTPEEAVEDKADLINERAYELGVAEEDLDNTVTERILKEARGKKLTPENLEEDDVYYIWEADNVYRVMRNPDGELVFADGDILPINDFTFYEGFKVGKATEEADMIHPEGELPEGTEIKESFASWAGLGDTIRSGKLTEAERVKFLRARNRHYTAGIEALEAYKDKHGWEKAYRLHRDVMREADSELPDAVELAEVNRDAKLEDTLRKQGIRSGDDPVVVVCCAKNKAIGKGQARAYQLYDSELFKKSLQAAANRGGKVYILSAEHGLIDPLAVISPYDKTVAGMKKSERFQWGHRAAEQLLDKLDFPIGGRERAKGDLRTREIIFYGGKEYLEPFEDALAQSTGRRASFVEPLKGLQVGERLKALNRELSVPMAKAEGPKKPPTPQVGAMPGTAPLGMRRGAPPGGVPVKVGDRVELSQDLASSWGRGRNATVVEIGPRPNEVTVKWDGGGTKSIARKWIKRVVPAEAPTMEEAAAEVERARAEREAREAEEAEVEKLRTKAVGKGQAALGDKEVTERITRNRMDDAKEKAEKARQKSIMEVDEEARRPAEIKDEAENEAPFREVKTSMVGGDVYAKEDLVGRRVLYRSGKETKQGIVTKYIERATKDEGNDQVVIEGEKEPVEIEGMKVANEAFVRQGQSTQLDKASFSMGDFVEVQPSFKFHEHYGEVGTVEGINGDRSRVRWHTGKVTVEPAAYLRYPGDKAPNQKAKSRKVGKGRANMEEKSLGAASRTEMTRATKEARRKAAAASKREIRDIARKSAHLYLERLKSDKPLTEAERGKIVTAIGLAKLGKFPGFAKRMASALEKHGQPEPPTFGKARAVNELIRDIEREERAVAKARKEPVGLAKTAVPVPPEGLPLTDAERGILMRRGEEINELRARNLGKAGVGPKEFRKLTREEKVVHLSRRVMSATNIKHLFNILSAEKFGYHRLPRADREAVAVLVARRFRKMSPLDLSPEMKKALDLAGVDETGIASGELPTNIFREKRVMGIAPARWALKGLGIVEGAETGMRGAWQSLRNDWNFMQKAAKQVIFRKGTRLQKRIKRLTLDSAIIFELVNNSEGDSGGLLRPEVSIKADHSMIPSRFAGKHKPLDYHRRAAKILQEVYEDLATRQGLPAERVRENYITHLIDPARNRAPATKEIKDQIRKMAKERLGKEYHADSIEAKLPADLTMGKALQMRDMLRSHRAPYRLETFKRRADIILGSFEASSIPGEVRQPFLEQRAGAAPVLECAVTAFETYARYALRKIHLEPSAERAKAILDLLPGEGQLIGGKGGRMSQREYGRLYLENILGTPHKADVFLQRIQDDLSAVWGGKLVNAPVLSWLFRPKLASRTSALAARLQYFRLLSLAVDSALTNLTQGVNTFTRFGLIKTAKGYAGLVNPLNWRHLAQERLMQEWEPFFTGPRMWYESPLSRFEKLVLTPFQLAERVNRGAAFMAGMADAKAKGLSRDKAVRMGMGEVSRWIQKIAPEAMKETYYTSEAEWHARRAVVETQFGYSAVESAPVFGTPLGRTFLQFWTYPSQQTFFILDELAQRAREQPYSVGRALRGLALIGFSTYAANAIANRMFGIDARNLWSLRGIWPRSLGPNAQLILDMWMASLGGSRHAREKLAADYGQTPLEWVTPRAVKKAVGMTHKSLGRGGPYRYLPVRPMPERTKTWEEMSTWERFDVMMGAGAPPARKPSGRSRRRGRGRRSTR